MSYPNKFKKWKSLSVADNDHWFVKYFKDNPFKTAATLSTLFGLINIFIYHLHIDYFPVFDFGTFASLIFSVAFVGFILFCGFSLLSFVPAIIIAGICIDDEAYPYNAPFFQRILACFAVSFFSFVICTEAVLSLGTPETDLTWCLSALAVAYWIVAVVVFFVCRTKKKLALLKTMKFAFLLFLSCLMQLSPLLAFMLTQNDTFGQKSEWWEVLRIVLFVGAMLQAVGIYLAWSWSAQNDQFIHRLSSLLLVFLFPFLMGVFSQNGAVFSSAMMRTTKIGNFSAPELTINKEGCAIAADADSKLCERKSKDSIKICHAYVMSRLGSETYLKIITKKDGNSPAQVEDIFLPTKDILGMKIDPKNTINGAGKFAAQAERLAETHLPFCDSQDPDEIKQPVVILSEKVLFDFDKYNLRPTGLEALTKFAEQLKNGQTNANLNGISIDIVGFTDQIGFDYHNLPLSQLRALSIEQYLASQLGNFSPRPIIHAFGEASNQLIKSDLDCLRSMPSLARIECIADNRRVEIRVTRQY